METIKIRSGNKKTIKIRSDDSLIFGGDNGIYKTDAKKLLEMFRSSFPCGTVKEFLKLANKIRW